METASCSPRASRPEIRTRGRPRKLSYSSGSAGSRWSWSTSKKGLGSSDSRELRKPVEHNQPELSGNRQCALLGLARFTLYCRPKPVGNRHCGSWPGSMLSTCKIPAAAAAGWWAIWPEMESRSAETGSKAPCGAWVFGRSSKNRAPRTLVIHPSGSPAWWVSAWSWQWTRGGPQISPTSLFRKAFSAWWRS